MRVILLLAGLMVGVATFPLLVRRDETEDVSANRAEAQRLQLHTSARVPLARALGADVADAAWHRGSEFVAITDSGLRFADARTKNAYLERLPHALREYSAYSWRVATADSLILMVHPALGAAIAYHTASRSFTTLPLGPLRRATDVCWVKGHPFIAGRNANNDLVVAALTQRGVDAERMLAIKTANRSYWSPRVSLEWFGDSLLIASGFPRRLFVADVDLTGYREIPAPTQWTNDDGIVTRSRSIEHLQRQALARGILTYAVRLKNMYLTLETDGTGRRIMRSQDAHGNERSIMEVAALFGLADYDRERCAFLGIQRARAEVWALQMDVVGPQEMLCRGRGAGNPIVVDYHGNIRGTQ